MLPAFVLTAGLATRLRPLSLVRAKAAMPVAGVPMVRRILATLAAAGITEAVLNLHHLPHTLTAVVGDGDDLGLRVRYSWEVPLLGSAGGPRLALDRGLLHPNGSGAAAAATARDILLVNGDTLTDLDIPALLADHRQSGALVTLAVVPNTTPEKYSGLAVTPEGAVTGVVPRGSGDPSAHFVGVQVARVEAFAGVPPATPWESIAAAYPALIAARPGSVRAFRTQARFKDVGTPDDYLETSLALAAEEGRPEVPGARARVDPTAHLERSVL